MGLKQRFGIRLKELRNKADLTQAELAERVGIATKTQGCIETGRNFPSASLIEKYAEVFNVDLSEILDISHIADESYLLTQINTMLKQANSEQTTIVYKFLKSLLH